MTIGKADAAAAKAGPAAQRDLLRAVKAGKVYRDVNGRTWLRVGRFVVGAMAATGATQKRMLSKPLLAVAEEWLRLDGDTFRLTEAGEQRLAELEER